MVRDVMSDGTHHALPQVKLAENDIRVIADILMGTLGYLRKTSKRTTQTMKRIQELEDIRVRLLFLRRVGGHSAVLLTVDDVTAIREAMQTFVKVTRQMVPQSRERDETLGAVNTLRQYIEKQLFV